MIKESEYYCDACRLKIGEQMFCSVHNYGVRGNIVPPSHYHSDCVFIKIRKKK